MKLTDLNPTFYGAGPVDNEGKLTRRGVGLIFDCPCGECGRLCAIGFRNPIDGGPPLDTDRPLWQRTGEDLETLTLTPSIHRSGPDSCGWHGFITNGEVTSV